MRADIRERRYLPEEFRTPIDLKATELQCRRVLVSGSCAAAELVGHCQQGIECDFVNFAYGSELSRQPLRDPSEYDFQVVQISARHLVGDTEFAATAQGDSAAHQAHFETACARLDAQLTEQLAYNVEYGLTTFVLNFSVPQQNPNGRLLPRCELSNPVFFFEKLNEHLARALARFRGSFLVDYDSIVASIGRRFVQDDSILWLSHNGMIPPLEPDLDRIEPSAAIDDYYQLGTNEARRAVWDEIAAMFRTVRQIDAVKLVVVDLDDTLWRGVAGELPDVGPELVEAFGWPFGFVEALRFLKKRGIILAVISKNSEERIREIFPKIMHGRIGLDDFVSLKIRFADKAEGMAEVLSEVNLLPGNVVFVDDNPVERAAMKAAFPAIRVLGPNHLHWRRILLWSPETQVPEITAESGRRSEMVQRQIARDGSRATQTRAEFLLGLNLRLTPMLIDADGHPRFGRALELLNKTNQFNTTGRKWERAELSQLLSKGGRLHAFEAEDRFSNYGLIAVGITQDAEIIQFVMSCRVAGLDVDLAALLHICRRIGTYGAITTTSNKTELNVMSRDLFARANFTEMSEDRWRLDTPSMAVHPSHVTLLDAGSQDAGIEAGTYGS